MSYNLRFSLAALSAAILLSMTGCSQLQLGESNHWPFGGEDKPGTPDQVVAMWTNTVLDQTGKPATRGFGGRLMFYDGKSKDPIKVEGKLIIYAFDETGRASDNVTPDRKYVFLKEQFVKHYSESEIGHSYSVWIPWGNAKGPQTDVSLITRFIPVEGNKAIVSEETKHFLPGTQLAAKRPEGRDAAVRPVSHEEAAPPKPRAQMTTTTIEVPSRFGSRAPVTQGRLRTRIRGVSPRTGASTGGATEPAAWPASLPPVATGVPGASVAPAPRAPTRTPPTRSAFGQSSTRYSPSRSQPLGGPIVRPSRDHAASQPSHVTSPYRPGPPPSIPPSSGSYPREPVGPRAPY